MLKWILSSTVAVLAAGVVVMAQAVTFQGVQPACLDLANVSRDVVGLRDAGVPWAAFKDWISPMLESAKGDPGSYVADDNDVAFVMVLFKQVYDGKKPVKEAEASVFAACMQTKVGKML